MKALNVSKLGILFTLLLVAALSACQTTPDQPTPTTAPPTAVLAPTATATLFPTEAAATVEPTSEEVAAVPTDTVEPPTNTPEPPTETPVAATETPTAVVEPTVPTEVLIEAEGASLPPGFSLTKFADVSAPTSLTFDEQGRLWTTSRNGEIHVFTDEDGDGRADSDTLFAFGFIELVGLAHHPNGDVYLSQQGKLSIARDLNGDLEADEFERFADLPYGRHQNNTIKFGPDGWLYLGVGSTCDVCYEEDPRSATIMRFNTETGEGEVFATGLRNAFDIAFDPATGALFSTENGRDDLGIDDPQEELNHIVQGADYGFPDCWNDGVGGGCDGTTLAIGYFEPRSSTNSLAFYTGSQFPAAYQGDLFAAVWGSFARPVDRGIHHITLSANGDTYESEMNWFVEWPDSWLLGLQSGPDGALYVGDFTGGGIWRISYGLP